VQILEMQRAQAALLIYRGLFDDSPGRAFQNLLQILANRPRENLLQCLMAYGDWVHALAQADLSWQMWLLLRLLQIETPFSRAAARQDFSDLSLALIAVTQHDLRQLQRLYHCSALQIAQAVQAVALGETLIVPWADGPLWDQLADRLAFGSGLAVAKMLDCIPDWGTGINQIAAYHRQVGSGLFSCYAAFRWQAGDLVGVSHPDPIRLEQLTGYEDSRQALLQNTEFLLAGQPAQNVLLYGSRGSGKSSLVKSLVHAYSDRGLRLIEVAKADLVDLPDISDRLRLQPQKFILFVDDLSFEEDERAYKALKVILEGTLAARPANVVVYATSNRRHLIREFFGDRPPPRDSSEIHAWDTVQEKLSLSDRFGLVLTFQPADQKIYLDIVHHLAQQANLEISNEELDQRALQWAMHQNARSGRTARQFINFLIAERGIKEKG